MDGRRDTPRVFQALRSLLCSYVLDSTDLESLGYACKKTLA